MNTERQKVDVLVPTGLEYTQPSPYQPALVNGEAIPFWDKKQASFAAKVMRMPARCVVRVQTRFDTGWALWTGTRFITRPEWIEAAKAAGIDLYNNDWLRNALARIGGSA